MSRLLACAAALLLWTLCASAAALPPEILNLSLATDTGSVLRLVDLRGKVVLIDFWASWCIPCRASFPAIEALRQEFATQGLAVVAINLDEERKDALGFLAARPHTFDVVFDPKGRTATALKLKGMPTSLIVDRAGEIRFTHVGYTETTVRQYRSEIQSLLGASQ